MSAVELMHSLVLITDKDQFIVTATTIIVSLTAIVLNRIGRQLLILMNLGGMVVAISIFSTDL